MDNTIQSQGFDSSNIIMFIAKRWKIVFGITLLGAILAAAATFLITPQFKSTVIIFPVESTSFAKDVASDLNSNSFLDFGDEIEVEKYLQILNSDQLKDMVIDKFNLYDHYHVDRNDSKHKTKIKEKYDSKISIERTKYLAINIEVLDEDPKKAAIIANEIPVLLDSLINKIKNERASVAFNLLNQRYEGQMEDLHYIHDTLRTLREKGVHSYEEQSERYTEAYAKALAAGNMAGAQRIEERLDILAEFGGAYVQFIQEEEHAVNVLGLIKKKMQELKMDINNKVPKSYIVEYASVSDKKAKPVRSLITLAAAFATFIFMVLLLMIKEWSKETK
ncbi:MAG: Wzz/FepE/Etk N-terminal domain-containing protein [Salinivirgaceae bacterium]